MDKNKSFTVIELLVVIAVIGLLSSVILVSMGGVRTKAKIVQGLKFSQSLQNALWNDAAGVWNFDEGSGIIALDASGNRNNGTLYNFSAPYGFVDDTPQKAGGGRSAGKYALSFSGTSYVLTSSLRLSQIAGDKLTLEAWVKPNGDGYILTKNGPYFLRIGGNKLQALIYNGVWTTHSGNKTLTTGNWHHVAATYDGANVNLYVNGQLDTSTPKSGNLAGDGCAQIGRYTDGGCNSGVGAYFNGTIDEVRVYGRALSIGEIQKHYAEGLEKHQLSEKMKLTGGDPL